MKKIISILLMTVFLFSLCSCGDRDAFVMEKLWDGESVAHENFTDLGNYVIELPDFDDVSLLAEGLAATNERYDNGEMSNFGCTAMVKTNDKGEVVVGRNMDVEISQYPAFVYKTTFGKYQTFAVTYTASSIATYEEIQEMTSLPEDYLALIPYTATDVFNEEGLYIESNMRSAYDDMSNYGLHTANGETTREDGIPWSELRACIIALPQLVGQNCATVEEAIAFVKNSYDWYTISMPEDPDYDGWNLCFVMGDATGNYGVLEIAKDTVSWLPYENGQANYYLTPEWNVLDTLGSGYGRLEGVYKILEDVQTLDDAMDGMKSVMWRDEMLWVGESYRDTNAHPYNQIVFQDDEGNAQMDWRSDYCEEWPVLDDGRLILDAETYENAKKSTYDTKILEYIEDAIKAGTLVVDDESILFSVGGESLTLTELRGKYEAYYEALWEESDEAETLKPYFDAYKHLLQNQTTYWCQDDDNFEALKARVYEALHTRYDEEGNYDPEGMSIYEKMKAYYGDGVEKNETYLRDDGEIWTTGLNIGVNCAQKQMKILFWENDETIYMVAW